MATQPENELTGKSSIVDADRVRILNSANSLSSNFITYLNLKTQLATDLDEVANRTVVAVNNTDYTIPDPSAGSIVYVVEVTTGASNRTITLPDRATNQARTIYIIKVDAGAGQVILDGAGSDTIQGAATVSLTTGQYDYRKIEAGADWYISSSPGSSSASSIHNPAGSYTILDDDGYTHIIDSATGTITLPTLADNYNRTITIKRDVAGSNTPLTVDGEGAETIEGNTTINLYGLGAGIQVIASEDAGEWIIISRIAGNYEDWTPTVTGSGAMTISGLTVHRATWRDMIGKIDAEFHVQATPGGTLSNNVYVSAPVDFTSTYSTGRTSGAGYWTFSGDQGPMYSRLITISSVDSFACGREANTNWANLSTRFMSQVTYIPD